MNQQPLDLSKLLHFWISMVKSGIRIVAGLALISGSLFWAGVLLIWAELLGILEEIV